VIRGYYLANKLGISFGFCLGTISLDRGLDLIIVSSMLFYYYFDNSAEILQIFSSTDLVVIGTGSLIFIGIILIILRTKYLLIAIQKIASLFSLKIANKMKNSVWGLILSYQQLRQNKSLARNYLFLVIFSWIATFGTLFYLILIIQNITYSFSKIFENIPFVSYVVLNGNDFFENYSRKIQQLERIVQPGVGDFLNDFATWSWIIFTSSYLIIALITLLVFTIRTQNTGENFGFDRRSRSIAIKNVAPSEFLDSFFMKERIIENIHRRSVSENYRIIEYFKGGSDAVTMLVQKPTGKVVHKVVGKRGQEKLVKQGQWLNGFHSEGIVRFIDSRLSRDFYEIEIEYIDNSISFYDFIHANSIESSKKVLLETIDILVENVYGEIIEQNIRIELDDYLQHNYYERIARVKEQSKQFDDLTNLRLPIIVNGTRYQDLQTIIELIFKSTECVATLSIMRTSEKCHGDLTVENILVRKKTNRPVLIDPSDDNQIRGPLLDSSRLMQSFLGGYEFLNSDKSGVEIRFESNATYINYGNFKSSQYLQLSEWLYKEVLPTSLNESEIKSIKFHVGILYARMLTHRYLIDEQTMFKYFATAIQYLNEFYMDIGGENE
jgi:hypothetical protein